MLPPGVTEAFDQAVDEAYAALPLDVVEALEARGISVVIDDYPPEAGRAIGGSWVPYLKTIFLYRSVALHEVPRLLLHEVAHAVGFEHDQMRERFPELMVPVECRR